MSYKLNKRLWNDNDYQQMGWHDCRIYKIGLAKDLILDIDYIIQWNEPEVQGMPFTFWVAPATLVFENITDIILDLNIATTDPIEIDDIQKVKTDTANVWTIETHQGSIEFKCNKFEQFIRQEPFFEFGQTINVKERYGFSLEKTINQENPNRQREDILLQRKIDLEHYEIAKNRHLSRVERDKLELDKEKNKLETKYYLQRKRDVSHFINVCDTKLKDTKFSDW